MHPDQYGIICSRRQSMDDKVWQVPSLAIAAQAFLLAGALGVETTNWRSLALSFLSLIVGAASCQLMAKTRQMEVEDAERLADFERQHAAEGYEVLHAKSDGHPAVPRNFLTRAKSYKIWFGILVIFAVFAAVVFLVILTLMMPSIHGALKASLDL
jgi:hypothetical protein